MNQLIDKTNGNYNLTKKTVAVYGKYRATNYPTDIGVQQTLHEGTVHRQASAHITGMGTSVG